MPMQKDLFLAEVAKIYFVANSYLELFFYLKFGWSLDVVEAQLNAIRSMDKSDLWQKIDAFNAMENLASIEKYVESQNAALAKKIVSLKLDKAEKSDLRLWFSCVSMLTDFASDKKEFLQKVVDFFEEHSECFYGEQYWALLALLSAENMLEAIISLSGRFGIEYDLPGHIIAQIYDAKIRHKH